MPEERRHRAVVYRRAGSTAGEQRVVRHTVLDVFVRERDETCAVVAAKRIGLRCPVQIAERAGKAAEMVLGGLVVLRGEQNLPPLLQERSQPLVDLGDGLRELLLARGMRGGIHLALHLRSRQTQ